jgi:hypothetical protein
LFSFFVLLLFVLCYWQLSIPEIFTKQDHPPPP